MAGEGRRQRAPPATGLRPGQEQLQCSGTWLEGPSPKHNGDHLALQKQGNAEDDLAGLPLKRTWLRASLALMARHFGEIVCDLSVSSNLVGLGRT